MAVWLVRAGKGGGREDIALATKSILIGFDELGDLSGVTSRHAVRDALAAADSFTKGALATYSTQVWTFVDRIQIGDIVALPLKSSAAIALGRVTGPYTYVPDAPAGARHRRSVQWVREDVPRSAFGQDLLYSLGAFLTVCRIQRNNADARIEAIMAGKRDPGIAVSGRPGASEETDADAAEAVDLERYGRDRIAAIISRKFAGHDLTRLVDAILIAEGYHTLVSPPGPDGGVDILAGSGPMGFDSPRICVQVKTGTADAPTLRDLQGTMHGVGADHGLLVAWAGFTKAVKDASRTSFFGVRLWDSDDLIARLVAVYDRLPAAMRDEIPLTQVWTVVEDEDSAT